MRTREDEWLRGPTAQNPPCVLVDVLPHETARLPFFMDEGFLHLAGEAKLSDANGLWNTNARPYTFCIS